MQKYLPFRVVADLWKENKRSMVKHSTFCAYMLILKTHLLPEFGDATVITESEVQLFALDKLKSGLSRKSVHDILAVLKAVAKYGANMTFSICPHGISIIQPKPRQGNFRCSR